MLFIDLCNRSWLQTWLSKSTTCFSNLKDMLRTWIITITVFKLKQLILKICFTVTFIFNAYAALFKTLLYTCASSWSSQTYNIPLGQKIVTPLLSVISHHFELFEDYRYAGSWSRLIKILWQKHYIVNARFQVQNIYHDILVKTLDTYYTPQLRFITNFQAQNVRVGDGVQWFLTNGQVLVLLLWLLWDSHEIYNICSPYPKDPSYQFSKELAT